MVTSVLRSLKFSVTAYNWPFVDSYMALNNYDFLSISQEIVAGKSVSDMTYLVSSGTLNLNSINQLT